jgi:PAS domain S-box-containing protein
MDNRNGPAFRQAEDRQNEELFRLLIASVSEYAIFLLDKGGHVASWNLGAERLKGYRASEIIGQHFSRFYPPEVSREVTDAELVTAANDGQFRDEGWRIKKDGSMFWADVTITPVRTPAGELLGFGKVTRDMTARRLAEQDRLRLVQEQVGRETAERSNRLKDEFLATLSHELRTPLNAIIGWATLIRQGADPETVSRGVDVIVRNALVQNQLIGDILDVQRLATGKLRLTVQHVDLVNVIEAALDTVRPAAATKSIALTPILDTTVGRVSGDPERLQQIVWNLLSNAIKFTPKGGRVSVRLRRVQSQVEITVDDTGPGIAMEFLPYIFERFRQSDASSTRHHGGLGLGLSIVRSLTELHGGTVTAANRSDGTGAVLTVRLPVTSVSMPELHVCASDGGETDMAVSLDAAPSLHGLTILVVDDQADGREIVSSILERCGAGVLTASSATEAFAMLPRTRPDAIVCDIGMPDENGYTFMKRVRALPIAEGGLIPAAALTAYVTTEDRMRALNAGFQIHIPKPVQPAELATVVASLCARTRSREV